MYGVTHNSAPQPPPALHAANVNPYCELRRVNDLLLRTFISLVDAMAQAPSQVDAKVVELRELLLNFQQLLNSLRPVQARPPQSHIHERARALLPRRGIWLQARADIVRVMEIQVARKQRLLDEIDAVCTSTGETLQEANRLLDRQDEPIDSSHAIPQDPLATVVPVL